MMFNGCSDRLVLDSPGDVGDNDSFILQIRELTKVYMEPAKESVFLVMGVVRSEVRNISIHSGTIDDIDYVFAKDYPGLTLGWDVLTTPSRIYKALGIQAENCSIPIDTPVDRENADEWKEYGECVKDLIEDCGEVFSHVDEDRNLISDCMDPREEMKKYDWDLIEDFRSLSKLHLGESSRSLLMMGEIPDEYLKPGILTGTTERSGVNFAIIEGEDASVLLNKVSVFGKTSAENDCQIRADTGNSLFGQLRWGGYINCVKDMFDKEGCGYTVTYYQTIRGRKYMVTVCIT